MMSLTKQGISIYTGQNLALHKITPQNQRRNKNNNNEEGNDLEQWGGGRAARREEFQGPAPGLPTTPPP